jgi:hypothetical protein
MAKKGGAAPKAPDPQQTAQAQTTSNVDTAKAQAQLNAVNQVTPHGSLTYTSRPGEGGVPQYTATQTLSPTGQKIFDQQQGAQLNLATVANEQSGKLNAMLKEPFSLDNSATEDRLLELGRSRLDPILQDRREALDRSYAQRGIMPGSTAYSKAQDALMQGENDAYNQLLLSGRNQAVQEALLQRQTPLNEMIALASGTQIQQPNFVGTPQTGVAGTDVAGITQNAYNQNYNAYRDQQQQSNSMLGGLFGLGANAMMAFSDRRLKENVKKIGKADNGLNLYLYNYKGHSTPQIGVMAQEVERKNPNAVHTHESGFKMVDYAEAV